MNPEPIETDLETFNDLIEAVEGLEELSFSSSAEVESNIDAVASAIIHMIGEFEYTSIGDLIQALEDRGIASSKSTESAYYIVDFLNDSYDEDPMDFECEEVGYLSGKLQEDLRSAAEKGIIVIDLEPEGFDEE